MINDFIENLNRRISDFTRGKEFATSYYLIFFYFGVFMYSFCALMNYIVGLSLITIIIPLISVFLHILFHMTLFKRGKTYTCVLMEIINNNFIASPFMWLTGLGFNGGFQYFIFMFMIFTVVLLKEKSRVIVVILYFIEMISLMTLEALNPELILSLSGMETNMADRIFSMVMSLITISITIFILSNLYRNEQEKIIELSTRDALTKQYNRRFIIGYMEKIYKSSNDTELENKYAVFIDVDDFKEINDKYGHNVGDRLLIDICDTIRKTIRETDYLARMGGDEFLLIINTENISKAKALIKRLIEEIKEKNNITISAGLTQMKGKSGTVELLEKADKMMYSAKREGKNRLFTAEAENILGDA
jgi:diguanylate cyclase (GGDEF)-like protein